MKKTFKTVLSLVFGLFFWSGVAQAGAHDWGKTPEDRCLVCHTTPEQQPDGTEACMACHDGSGARFADVKIAGLSSHAAAISHPIGVRYPLRAGYRSPMEVVSRGAYLQGDVVVCTSCHNPHSTNEPALLRVNNNRSALCFVCHDL